MAHINDVTEPEYIDIATNVENESKKFSTEMDADMDTLLKGLDSKNITVSQWNAAIFQLGYTAADVRRVYGTLKQIALDLDSNLDGMHDYIDAIKAAVETAFENTVTNAEEYADSVAQTAETNAKEYADTVTSEVLGSDSSDKRDMTIHSNRKLIEENASRIADLYSPDALADLVITTEEEFDQCLYPLYKDEETLTREQAAYIVNDDSTFNTPDPNFKAKRVLVKGVIFKKRRGYDDVRMHVFQPSIEYIKFDNCRWETHWKVSGKNPRDPSAANYNLNTLPERATAFNRATDPLTLTIEGLHITEDNVSAARVSDQWGIGLRNIKVLKNCYIDYPKNYRLEPEGYAALEMSCQFFDFADNCSISGLWDGTNVVNCKVSKILKRCSNVANLEAVNLFNQNGNIVPLKVLSCVNMVNIKGTVTFTDVNTPSCEHEIAATREVAQAYADAAEQKATNVANTKVPIGTPVWGTYHEGLMLYGQSYDGSISFKHATTRSGGNEVAVRDAKGRLVNSWQDLPSEYVVGNGWDRGTCMPKHYIDALVKGGNFKKYQNGVLVGEETTYGYAPLNDMYKIDATYLPAYVDDVIEGYLHVVESEQHFSESVDPQITDAWYTPENGKIYVDLSTNKTYRWSGSKYVEISQSLALGTTSSTAFAGDKGQTAYAHSQSTGNPHGTTAENVGAVPRLPHSANGKDYRAYVQDNNNDGEETFIWASQKATHEGDTTERGTVAVRSPSGTLDVASPELPEHAANKAYVDSVSAAMPDDVKSDAHALRSYLLGGDGSVVSSTVYVESTAGTPIAGAVPLRDSSKQLHVPTTPTAPTHAASKSYVDTLGLGAPAYGTATNIYGMFAIPNRGTAAQYLPAAEGVPSFSFPSVVLRSSDGRLYCKTDNAVVNDYEIVNKKFLKSRIADFASESFAIPAYMWGDEYEIDSPYYNLCGFLDLSQSPSYSPVLANVRHSVQLTIKPTTGMTSYSARVPLVAIPGAGYVCDIVLTATVNSVTSKGVNVKFQVLQIKRDDTVSELDYTEHAVSFDGYVSQVNMLGVWNA